MSQGNRQRIDALAGSAGATLGAIRVRGPRIHCLTSPVAMVLSANVLLAVGATPSMTATPDGVADFVRGSDALLVNLGMLDAGRLAAAEIAAPLARELGRPWVLDPVKIERSPARLETARALLAYGPAVVRANGAETTSLAGDGNRAWAEFARERRLVLATTGPVDVIVDGERELRLANGSPLMDRVTAIGCAGSALLAAFLAVEADRFAATVAALAVLGVAGEIAAEGARGPGSFVPAFIDALAALDAASLAARLRVA